MLLRPPNTARISAGFVAFHPLILIESVAFAHGDILMLVLLCVALAAYRKGAIEICAAVIALAMEARVIAGLALLVLLMKAARDRDTRLLLRAGFASSATVVLTVLLSFAAYHTFTLGGSPSIEPYSSPLLLAFNAAGPTMAHVTLGGTLQALLGLAIVLPLMLAGRFSYVPLASLAILPMMRAWYCQWVIPQIAIEGPSKARYAAAMLAGVGIVSEWPEMTGHSDPVTWAIILSLQWLLPAAVLLGYAKRKGTLRLTAPNPATSAP
jgi:hypothetical protein